MAKLTLSTLATLRSESALTTANANHDLIEAALENTLSRDGTSPNEMEANLDMNSNRVVNLPAPASAAEPLRYADLLDVVVSTDVLTFTSISDAELVEIPSVWPTIRVQTESGNSLEYWRVDADPSLTYNIRIKNGDTIGDFTSDQEHAFDDDIVQSTASAVPAEVPAMKTSATSAYIGKTYLSAKKFGKAVLYSSSNAGFIVGANPSITVNIRGKNGVAPVSATDGTIIGTLTFTDTGTSNTQTVTSTDTTTEYLHIWAEFTTASAVGDWAVAEVVFYKAGARDLGFFQSADGQWWDLVPPSEHTVVDITHFLRQYSNHSDALYAAFKTLCPLDEVGAEFGYKTLEGYRIPLDITEPFILRYPLDIGDAGNFEKGGRIISNLSLVADPLGDWRTRDYLFSICGEAGLLGGEATPQSFVFEKCYFDLGDLSIIGWHGSGLADVTINHMEIHDIGTTGIGIYSSRFIKPTGVADGTDDMVGAGHGVNIRFAELFGGTSTDTTIGIYTENGDLNIEFCRFNDMGTAILAQAGMNLLRNHFSLSSNADGTKRYAVYSMNPRGAFTSFQDECDHSYYFFDDSPDQVIDPTDTVGAFSGIAIVGTLFSGSNSELPAGHGYITFNAQQADTVFRRVVIMPAFAAYQDTAAPDPEINLVSFLSDGVADFSLWDVDESEQIVYFPSIFEGLTIAPGSFPGLTRLRIAETNEGGVDFSPNHAAGACMEFWDETTATKPYIRANGDTLRFGGSAEISVSAGGDLTPVSGSSAADCGSTGNPWRNVYVNRAVGFTTGAIGFDLDNGTATANAGNAYTVAVNKMAGRITTDSLTTAAGASQTLTITSSNSKVTATSIILVTRNGGTNTAGTPVYRVVPGANTFDLVIENKHAANAFNGTFDIGYVVFN